jgi:hypothetical protein
MSIKFSPGTMEEISCESMESKILLKMPNLSGFPAWARPGMELRVNFWSEMMVAVIVYQI